MTAHAIGELLAFLVLLTLLAVPLGALFARALGPAAMPSTPERWLYRVAGVDPAEEMKWTRYAGAVLLFNLFGGLLVYAIQRLQSSLPLNPGGLGGVEPGIAWNTAVSFATNTNWQAYGGETTMSHFTQMAALTVQNFVSAATGLAVLMALIRGLTRTTAFDEGSAPAGTPGPRIGNFWVDLTRSTLLLLPLATLWALVLVAEGTPQTLEARTTAALVEGGGQQSLAVGPVASQVAIKQLGTNGGGFFNVNSAHPLENPTPMSNTLEVLAIVLLGAALCFTFGHLVKDRRQGWALYAAMLAIFVPVTLVGLWSELKGVPALEALGVDPSQGHLEGKEARFGVVSSVIWSTVTTAASNGSVNAMHDSFTPLAGMMPLWLMQLGEIIFGGVGSGLYGILLYVMVAVFISGLLVGRTPEYLGKKIEAREMKLASLGILLPAASVLLGTALASATQAGTSPLGNPGAHGFSEMLYAFTSGSNNNGSAFGGLTASGTFYTVAIGTVMLIGRYWVIVPVLALAGSLAGKRRVPSSAGTLPTHTPLFVALLVGTIVLVGALTFIPALALGPIVEHLQMTGVTP
ncbi:MAG: potassium-transporting ATPase subunit KdpA [Myxococcales bacterium]|nr:potassium-transporting ATPase subunit KdpA [Myxococcales bacterium]